MLATWVKTLYRRKTCVCSSKLQGHVLHYHELVFSPSTLYFGLAGDIETKQVVNRMSKYRPQVSMDRKAEDGNRK